MDPPNEGIKPGPIIESMLKQYETNDRATAKKIEFRRLVCEIVFAFRTVKSSVRSKIGGELGYCLSS